VSRDGSVTTIANCMHAPCEIRRQLEPLRRALTGFVAVLAESAGALVTLVAAAAPWLVLVVPALWLLRRWWRARRA